MDRYKVFIALGVLVILGIGVYFAYRKPAEESAEALHDPWHTVDKTQTTKIVIQRPNNAPAIELEKRDNHWFMNQPAQGPADEQAVNDALTALAEMHVASVAARETGSYPDMEVDTAHAIHVQLFRGTTPQIDLFIGKNLDGGSAVRAPSNPLVYRVDRSIRFNLTKEPREWRDRDVTHLERAHVRSVEWTGTHGTFHFDRNGDTWTPAATNPPIERLDTARLNQTINNLLSLRATDFAAANASTGITATSPHVAIAMDNGPTVTVKSGSASPDGLFVQREGSDIVFIVGRTHEHEIDFDPSAVQSPPPVTDAGHAGDAAAAPPAMPMAAHGDGGAPTQLPPEVMEQIRRQMMQRQMMQQAH